MTMLDDSLPIDLETLLTDAVQQAVRHEDADRFMAWIVESIDNYSSDELAGPESAGLRQALAVHIGRALWNSLPLPGNRLAPRRLPAPGRNDLCLCGSGRKFKRCCAKGPSLPDQLMDPEELVPMVLEAAEPEQLDALTQAGRPHPRIARLVAEREYHAGNTERARDVLEALFQSQSLEKSTSDDLALAFTLLCDIHDALGEQARKEELADAVRRWPRGTPTRAMAWCRMGAIRADAGNVQGAQQAFAQAERDDPGSAMLATMEVAAWASHAHYAYASERAAVWEERLMAAGYPPDNPGMEFLARAIDEPEGLMLEGAALDSPELERLDELVEQAVGRRLPGYRCVPSGMTDDTGEYPTTLQPPDSLQSLLDQWRSLVNLPPPEPDAEQPLPDDRDPWDAEQVERWLGFLQAHPEALDALEVVDDVVTLLRRHESADPFTLEMSLMVPLLDRVKSTVMLAVESHHDGIVSWSEPANRAGLRALLRLWQLSDDSDRAMDLIEFLLRLDPADPFSLRISLAEHYLEGENDEGLAALGALYPGDAWPQLTFGRALALFRLGELLAADDALDEAVRGHPRCADALLRKRVRHPPPRSSTAGVIKDGPEQVAEFQSVFRPHWDATTGAMAWLRRVRKRHP